MVARRLFATTFCTALIATVLATTVAVHADGPSAASTAATPAPTPEAAILETAQAAGAVYAGDCAGTTPANGGQVCSKYIASNGQMRAYLTGLTFSEFTQWVFVEQTPSGWIPLSTAAFDDAATSLSIPWPAG